MQIGLFFAIFPVIGIPISMLVKYIPAQIEKRLVLICCFVLCFIAYLCVGPSDLLYFPDSLFIMGLGQFLAGITYTTVICLSLPEMVDGVKGEYPG